MLLFSSNLIISVKKLEKSNGKFLKDCLAYPVYKAAANFSRSADAMLQVFQENAGMQIRMLNKKHLSFVKNNSLLT